MSVWSVHAYDDSVLPLTKMGRNRSEDSSQQLEHQEQPLRCLCTINRWVDYDLQPLKQTERTLTLIQKDYQLADLPEATLGPDSHVLNPPGPDSQVAKSRPPRLSTPVNRCWARFILSERVVGRLGGQGVQ
jgi:hypothetical protein